jgi:hypothetical protein
MTETELRDRAADEAEIEVTDEMIKKGLFALNGASALGSSFIL